MSTASDPLAEVVGLLQPGARHSKRVSGAGAWRIRRTEVGQPFHAVILEGGCRLSVDGAEPMALQAGDFVLVPAANDFEMESLVPPAPGAVTRPVLLPDGEHRVGDLQGPVTHRGLVGHFSFASPDAPLLVSLLPRVVHVRGEPRLAVLVQLLGDESRADRPARDVILARLLEVLMIEALRASAGPRASPGLLRGLADDRLAVALRQLHASPTRHWTVAELARASALSRSAFFDRFSRALGVAPMEYLLAWRMALAKRLLRQEDASIADVAERVGYGSASTFSVAFARFVGMPPARYARAQGGGGAFSGR